MVDEFYLPQIPLETLQYIRAHMAQDYTNVVTLIEGRCNNLAYLKQFQVHGPMGRRLCNPHQNQAAFPVQIKYMPWPMLFVFYPQLR